MPETTDPHFIHLRTHTAYSLAEGAIKLKSLLKLCDAHGMPATAVTDTNNMFGALDFAISAVKAGVQPILGVQLDVRYDAKQPDRIASIVLLAQSEPGYRNLCRLVSRAHMGRDASVDVGLPLSAFDGLTDGVICLSGGPSGPVSIELARHKNPTDVTNENGILTRLQALFPDRLYIELMRHGDYDVWLDQALIELAHETGLPLVATNNNYFPKADFYEAHDALLCIAGGAYVTEEDRRRETPDHYFKSPEEMLALFADVPEATANTVQIAKRCHFILKKVAPELPDYPTQDGCTQEEEMRVQAEEGLRWRLEHFVYTPDMDEAKKAELEKEYFDRLEMEMGIIFNIGFPGYFLVVADFIQWAKDNDIPVGPGRGSGAGSIVAWAMKIIDIDPIDYGLLFERFLNPERVSMPDFDVDFCQTRRGEVINYVRDKYGADRVGQIITFGKLQARAVVRDVGRVLQMPYGQVDRLCKMIPNNPANPVTLQEAIDDDEELQRLKRDDEDVGRLLTIGLQLEGLYRHASTHAAGVVIGNRPLEEIVPMYQDPNSDMPATQFNMKFVEDASLVKFDFLGLKTLTVLKTACDNIKQTRGEEIDLLQIPMDEEKAVKLCCSGHTRAVFQFEGSGAQDMLVKAQPTGINDLIALTSLNRPGPMDNFPRYVTNKKGETEPDYLHPLLEDLLRETYGIIVYQEQVMEVARRLAGYSLGGADLLRRAMGKKIKEKMDEERVKFVKGAAKVVQMDDKRANEIFDILVKFAGYGFNKSHAAAYSLITYQTAYLKAHYPMEFMAAVMTLDAGNTDKLNLFRQDLRLFDIPLLPPCVNASIVSFGVEEVYQSSSDRHPDENQDLRNTKQDSDLRQNDKITHTAKPSKHQAVRYALGAVKGAGTVAMETIVAERQANGPYKSLEDFLRRLDMSVISKKQIEALASAGALDGFGYPRAQLVNGVEAMMDQAHMWAQERASGQTNLFAAPSSEAQASGLADGQLTLPPTPEWTDLEVLQYEFGAIGFYLSAHPLDSHTEWLEAQKIIPLREIVPTMSAKRLENMRVKIAGVMIKKTEKRSDRGRFAFVTLSDPTNLVEITLYTETLMACREHLENGALLVVEANASLRGEDDMRLIAQRVTPMDQAMARNLSAVTLMAQSPTVLHQALEKMKQALANENTGNVPPLRIRAHVQFDDLGAEAVYDLGGRIHVPLSEIERLKTIDGLQIEVV